MAAEDRKLAIVTAALPLFARKGFAETTTKDLAKAAGVSEPLLYRHFPSKEALYEEIQNFTCRANDPTVRKLTGLKPSTSTLVRLIYYLLRALIMEKPASVIGWNVKHRLMLNSLLEDGAFARLLYRTRFEEFCGRIETCLDAAIAAGEAVPSPISDGNRARFAHHLGAWLALVYLPETPAIDYKVSRDELLAQAIWFSLRGMGITDKAIATHFDPQALADYFQEQ